jgi:hypothetical protein
LDHQALDYDDFASARDPQCLLALPVRAIADNLPLNFIETLERAAHPVAILEND